MGIPQMTYPQALDLLSSVGQEHVLAFFHGLSADDQRRLLEQVASLDWPMLAELIESHVIKPSSVPLPHRLEPAPYLPAVPTGPRVEKFKQAKSLGQDMIRAGRVAAFTVAGGQGTRLGWDAPKGTFPASPVTNKPLFQLFAEAIHKTGGKYGRPVPWYIMTSPINDAATRAFFADRDYFGLSRENVVFFPQGTVPSFSLDGKVLLESPRRIAVNPDGHGGSLRALHDGGALADMKRRGVEQVSYFQVDNPLVHCVDPLFIGLHAMEGSQMSSKMVVKSHAEEKVGVFVLGDGKVQVIEYSDMPPGLTTATHPDGSLRFNAGSIAIHAISVAFIERLNSGRFGLPWHRAVKKVPYVEVPSGRLVTPEQPNAVKLETFVFDALPLCEKSLVLETLREEEFAPIKNAEGADSPHTSRTLQSERARRWLLARGIKPPESRPIEISPLHAVDPEDLLGLEDAMQVVVS